VFGEFGTMEKVVLAILYLDDGDRMKDIGY